MCCACARVSLTAPVREARPGSDCSSEGGPPRRERGPGHCLLPSVCAPLPSSSCLLHSPRCVALATNQSWLPGARTDRVEQASVPSLTSASTTLPSALPLPLPNTTSASLQLSSEPCTWCPHCIAVPLPYPSSFLPTSLPLLLSLGSSVL